MHVQARKSQDKKIPMNKPYRNSRPSILKQLSGLTKGTISLLAMFFFRMGPASLVSQPIMLASQQTMKFYQRDIWLYLTSVLRSMPT